MTYLDLVNRVLRRLREDTVTDFSAEYTRLIADFVAEAHKEVLEAHDWSVFDQYVTVTMTAGVDRYQLDATTLGSIYTSQSIGLHKDCMLHYNNGAPCVWWFATPSTPQGIPLAQIGYDEWFRRTNINTANNATRPTAIALTRQDDGFELDIWPKPTDGGAIVKLLWNIPELQLDSASATSTTILAPWRPIVLGALYLALDERGEELGEPGNVAERRYYDAIAAAKESDMALDIRTNKYEFYKG